MNSFVELRRPQGICRGDTIGIFTPSFPMGADAPAAAARGIAFLEANGFRVKCGDCFGAQDGYRSASIAARAAEWNALLHDPSVTCLMAASGGYVTNSILPFLDWDYLRAHPKCVVGQSDITALLLAVAAKAGVCAYHGPNLVTGLARSRYYAEQTLQSLLAVTGRTGAYDCPLPEAYSDLTIDWAHDCPVEPRKPLCVQTIQGGTATGRLWGGNLCTLLTVFGSDYLPRFETGDLLFLEDVDSSVDAWERHLATLALAGWLERAGGIILGIPRNYDDLGTGKTEATVLLELLHGRSIPILAQFPCSHTAPLLTLPMGGWARLAADTGQLTLL